MKKVILFAVIFSVIFLFPGRAVQADSPPLAAEGVATTKIGPEVQQAIQGLQANDMITVIVRLKDQENLTTSAIQDEPNRAIRLNAVVNQLRVKASDSQQALKVLLDRRQAEGRVSAVTYFWIFNGLTVTATADVIQEIAAQPEVLNITPDRTIQAPPAPEKQGWLDTFAASQPNLEVIHVPDLWAMGYKGQGVVIATLDTGVGFNNFFHPDLWAKWRGGSNSWFDPYGQHPATPTDVNGHGTEILGAIIGGEHNGTAFGTAPEAQWIAAKIFKDDDSATATGIHLALQWVLDPDGNPQTADAPHVVNNSWTWYQGCDLEFQADLQALRAAGILPVFAAGNSALTSHSPANYPEAFAVGATDNFDNIWNDSSRGPSACDGTTFPEVVAPGVNIHTTSLFGTYTDATGTSLAAPQVAGALAVLLGASPNMTVSQQESALLNAAIDQGDAGPDNIYGYGRVDFLVAYQSIVNHQVYLPVVIK